MDVKTFPAFAGLSDFEIASFVSACQKLDIAEDQTIVTEDGVIDRLYFILEGGIRVHVNAAGTEQELAIIAAPSVIGEIELFVEGAKPASVTAIEPLKAIAMPYSAFRQRIAGGDIAALKIVANFAKVLANRLHHTDRRVSALAAKQ